MRVLPLRVVVLLTVAWGMVGCGRTEPWMRPWHGYETGVRDGVHDVGPPDADAPQDVEPDAPRDADAPQDTPLDADVPEFTGLSCLSAAMCALCCPPDQVMCQIGCMNEADPSARGALTAILGCAMGSSCGTDFACLFEDCAEEFAECGGGPGGVGGCLELAWCLVSSGCASQEGCVDQGLCYQDCFGAARPEVAGAARDLLVCVVGVCAAQCATGITTTECISCLGLRCLPTLRACIGL